MSFKRTKVSTLAAGVALGVAAMTAQGATQPVLATGGASAGASFSGGGTISGGANYLATVPSSEKLDLVATIKPATADVGKTGTLVAILTVEGVGTFTKLSGGIWVPFDANKLQGYATKTLTASESVNIVEDLIGDDANLAGAKLTAYVGYWLGDDITTITYTNDPVVASIAKKPTTGCPTNTAATGTTFSGKPVCELKGRIETDTHLTANNAYQLSSAVFIGTNTDTDNDKKISLTIDAGTTVFSPVGFNALVIDKSAKIHANGSPENPIIMTSSEDVAGYTEASTARGKWGGLVINGSAQLNSSSGYAQGEGNTGQYGGGTSFDNADSSGNVNYTQIKYAGYLFTPEDELNSLALQGVGSGTNLDYIQIHNGADDGIEFYGGNVDAKHLYLTGIDDDSLDWTTGYTGKLQHVLIKLTNTGDNCIEADNLGANPTATPRSIPTISNLTCVLSPNMSSKGHAMELKAGTGMNMYNSVIGGTMPTASSEGCVRMATAATWSQSGATIATLNGTLAMQNSLITTACLNDMSEKGTAEEILWTGKDWYGAQTGSSNAAFTLGGTLGTVNGTEVNAIAPDMSKLTDAFWDQVDYIGAVKDTTSDWTKGWTFNDF